MEIKYILVTPDIAKQWLQTNKINRKLKRHLLDRYLNDIKTGKWKEGTAETIKISSKGTLLDGQHRLAAIIQSGKSLYFHVAFDVSDNTMDVLDTGQPRGASDVFYMHHIKNASNISVIITSYLRTKRMFLTKMHVKTTNQDVINIYNSNEDFWQETFRLSAQWYHSSGRILSKGIFGAMYAIFYEIDAQDAIDFFELLANSNGISNKPVNLLRSRLANAKFTTHKITEFQRNALIFKTWNYYRERFEIKQLMFDAKKEAFPIPS